MVLHYTDTGGFSSFTCTFSGRIFGPSRFYLRGYEFYNDNKLGSQGSLAIDLSMIPVVTESNHPVFRNRLVVPSTTDWNHHEYSPPRWIGTVDEKEDIRSCTVTVYEPSGARADLNWLTLWLHVDGPGV